MYLRSLLLVIAAVLGISACGSSRGTARNASASDHEAQLARKCGESEATLNANIAVFVKAARAYDGHRATNAEAAAALYTLANYAEQRHGGPPDCKGLLVALITAAKRPPGARFCVPYQTGRVCVVPPIK